MDEGNNLAADLFFSHISTSLSARLTSPSLILHFHKAAGPLFSPPLTRFAACSPTLGSFFPSYILSERCAGQLSPVVFSFSLKCCQTTKMNPLSDASHSLPINLALHAVTRHYRENDILIMRAKPELTNHLTPNPIFCYFHDTQHLIAAAFKDYWSLWCPLLAWSLHIPRLPLNHQHI